MTVGRHSQAHFVKVQSIRNQVFGEEMLRVTFTVAFAFAFITCGAFASNQDADVPTVTTSCGVIAGKVLTTNRGQCDAYTGVPFAAPPIGDLRWQQPQEPKCWTGVKNASVPGPICIQINSTGKNPIESEDCLVLNIFSPRPAGSSKLPVMVFIHGGAFIFGSARDYGEEGPCENVATRGVILVLIQYRLFMYGFFSTGDKTAMGNYGLWDQVEALRWVKKNIASFGGDPDRVTVFGESAGAASVSYLTYTPVAKDLFHQSLAESGSVFSSWAGLSDVSVKSAKQLANAAACYNSNSEVLIKCLRSLTTPQLQAFYNSEPSFQTDDFYHVWSARVDGDMFTSDQFREIGTKRPAVIGVNSMEMPVPDVQKVPFVKSILNSTLASAFPGDNLALNDALSQTAMYIYIDSKGNRNDNMFAYEQTIKMQADLMFHAAAPHEAQLKVSAGSPVWVYEFDYWSDNLFPPGYPFKKGAPHAYELCYLFLLRESPNNTMTCPDNFTGVDRQVADYLGEMWTNFAIHGDPSPIGLKWSQFQDVTNASAMTIRSNLSVESQYYLEVTNFWYSLRQTIERDIPAKPSSSASVNAVSIFGTTLFIILQRLFS